MRVEINRFEGNSSMRLQTTGSVGIITINRSFRRNALTREMWTTLYDWCCNLPSKVKLLIIRGSGKDFSAGSDIKEFATLTAQEANEAFETIDKAITTVEKLEIPTIAVVTGPAYGAGFILSLACDLRIGSETAQFGMPVGKLGITLQPPFIQRMVHNLGPSRTMEMVYTASTYRAQQAKELGLLNALVSNSQLDDYVFDVARSILEQSMASMMVVKKSVRLVMDGKIKSARSWVDEKDFNEGITAFNEKRNAKF